MHLNYTRKDIKMTIANASVKATFQQRPRSSSSLGDKLHSLGHIQRNEDVEKNVRGLSLDREDEAGRSLDEGLENHCIT
ncbi:predicted protein [Sclerotinia sclerotiorum 1980 UF-70]|uniref:Uncharacterized protein n=1 Tax=Sclerotinia sclerotiorum (strain ATCC 18683 / 1980 / Ss-1) TaxID=665079 RepID=A7F3U0_SCLS1|nr:predicted protein [Sclerotinia sclerotiorum 1980 UF-70]EDN97411.1 predicted protein [Sclerotinia sclerotiorum 1980 UF-70]